MFKKFLYIFLGTVWISFSEFIRNEFLFKSFWVEHYQKIGLIFPSTIMNGIVWGIWSFCLAVGIFIISKKFTFKETIFISWFFSFVMMWLVIENLGVLPYGILLYAVPLSLFEVFIAVLILRKSTIELL